MRTLVTAVPPHVRARRRAATRVALRLGTFFLAAAAAGAGGPQFSTFFGGSEGEFAAGVATDPQGNVYIAGQTSSADLPVTPGASQRQYAGGSDAFVAKYSPDGALLWATYYGGSNGDGARGIAVDPQGNVLIAGITGSLDLPVSHALSAQIDGGHLHNGVDAFVARLDTNGKIIYATYLGGNCNDWAWAIAADARGNAYITGDTCSADFPARQGTAFPVSPFAQGAFVAKLDSQGTLVYSRYVDNVSPRGIAVDSTGAAYITGSGNPRDAALLAGQSRIFVVKLAPDGSAVTYASTFGGTLGDWGLAIAVDFAGSAYVTGVTGSADFPLVHPLQPSLGARTLWKSADSGVTWTSVEDSPLGSITTLLVDPETSGTLYAATTDGGVFKSTDGGASWTHAAVGLSPQSVQTLALDPHNPRTLYASTGIGCCNSMAGDLYKSTDAAATWQLIDSKPATQILVDGTGAIYAYGDLMRKSTDGGVTWTNLVYPGGVISIALDPNASGTIYAPFYIYGSRSGHGGLYRSKDDGATWETVLGGYAPAVLIDASQKPSTIYFGTSARSDDGGVTWTPINPPADVFASLVAIDPVTHYPIAAALNPQTTLAVSPDRGLTWQPAPGSPVVGPFGTVPYIVSLVLDPTSPATRYATLSQAQTSAFVTKLTPDGSGILFSTYLHGHASMDPSQNTGGGSLLPPASPTGSNYATGIALDANGNIAIGGATRSTDFFTVNAWQPSSAGQYDAFAALISADTNWLYYSTYLGGGLNDQARGIAVDSQGNLILAGQTHSGDFPTVNPQAGKGRGDDAFVTKIAPQLPPGVTR